MTTKGASIVAKRSLRQHFGEHWTAHLSIDVNTTFDITFAANHTISFLSPNLLSDGGGHGKDPNSIAIKAFQNQMSELVFCQWSQTHPANAVIEGQEILPETMANYKNHAQK